MYAGTKVEEADRSRSCSRAAAPLHARPAGLDPAPRGHRAARPAPSTERLQEIPGIVPALTNLPPGCSFAPRCPFADDQLPRAIIRPTSRSGRATGPPAGIPSSCMAEVATLNRP